VPLPAWVQDEVLMVIYLHGFASSGASGKASYLGERLRGRGERFAAPDLNLPDFATLTITRMIEQVRTLIAAEPEPVTLIGSSLGAYVAVNLAAKWPALVRSLILLAPALDLRDLGGEQLQAWRDTGQLMVFHFAYGRMIPVHYELYEDARRYDTMNAEVRMPILVVQGRRDVVVHPATVEAWSKVRPNVQLHLVDDDHQLTASLPLIWDLTSRFLDSLPGSPRAAS
jgi:pimeloyl-ACP methyl ester carboxylesterase